MEVEFEMKSTEALLRTRGLQKNGPVQKLVDSECWRYMSPYMPRRQAGELEHMMVGRLWSDRADRHSGP